MRIRLATLVVLVSLLGCATSSRTTALQVSLSALDAARDGFIAWDKEHQESLLESSADGIEARGKISSYREQRRKVVTGFELAYTAVALAAVTVGDEGDRNFTNAAIYVYNVYELIRMLMKP